jgi:hypothetical protein
LTSLILSGIFTYTPPSGLYPVIVPVDSSKEKYSGCVYSDGLSGTGVGVGVGGGVNV